MRYGMRATGHGSGLRTAILLAGTVAIGLPLALAAARIGMRATLLSYLAYNEGWNAYHAAAAFTGGTLYYPPGALVANNYPPLSFYLAGWVGSLVGDALLGGRYVAFLSYLVTVAATYLAARGLAADRLSAAFGAVTTGAALLLAGNYYAGMSDPQMLAHALGMSGLAVFVSPRLGRWPAGLLGGALIASSCFVKHMVVGLPFCLFVSCVLFRRDMVVPLVAGALIVIGLLGTWIALSFGSLFFQQFLSPRVYSLSGMVVLFTRLAQPWVMMMAAALFLLLSFRPAFPSFFAASYTLVGFALALFFLGGEGVNENAVFEGIIAGGLAFALLLSRVPAAMALATVAIVLFQLMLPFSQQLERRHLSLSRTLEVERSLVAETAGDVDFIRAHPGPALCEGLSLCFWAGKPILVDPFNAVQSFKTGRIPESKLLDRVRAREFSTIQLLRAKPPPEKYNFHFSAAFDQAVAENYQIAHKSQIGAIFVPKP